MNRKKSTEKLKITENPPILQDATPLTGDERRQLIAMLNSPVFIKTWGLINLCRPNIFPAEGYNTQMGLQSGFARLHEMRGWELFKRALILQSMEPATPRREVPVTFTE